ncbi:UNVERIFIED_CONTAM: Zinc finger CCCH domain-containing protein 7 [Sesamum radiatum]|uniref:Zinc finger CCCH domain-containing protein 7 n=1 Tax=Sesamum radiatum TaxID=300843 RepID=A0AAW2M6L8_SESRA
MQEKNALRIKLGKACSRRGGGYKSQHFSKELSSGSFRGKRKQEFEWSQPRSEDKKEREQSPMELAISFKSNALVAKAILAPSCPDLRYDSQGSSKELPDEAAVSGRGNVTASDANGLGENALKNGKDMNLWGPNNIDSGRKRRSRLRKKRKNGKQHLRETNLQITKDIGDINNAKDSINCPSVVPQLNSDTTLSKGNTSSEFIGTVPDTVLPPSLGFLVSENGDINSDSYKPSVPNLKRKRSCLTSLPASSCMADNLGSRCSGRAESLVPTTEDTNHMCQLRTDERAPYAHEPFLANKNTGHEGSLGFNNHADAVDKLVSNRASVLGTKKSPVESFDRHRLDYTSGHSSQVGLASLESAFAKGASGVKVSVEGHGMVGLSRPQEDKYFSETREPNSASLPYSALLKNPGSVIISKCGAADGNQGDFSNQVNIRKLGLDADEFRSSEGADVAGCSNASSGIATSSHFLSADRKGILTQFDVSFPGVMCKKSSFDGAELSDNVRSIEGSPKAISNVNGCSSINYSPNLVGKRKTRDAQMGLSGSKTNLVVRTVRSIGGEGARLLAKDRLPSLEVDCCEVDHGANGYRKKRKGGSPISNLSSILEDDTIADGLTSDCPKLDQGFTGLSEREAEQREVTPSVSAAIKNCDTISLDDEVGSETFYVADVDETMADDAELHANDRLASSAKNLPLFADRNCVYASSSSDELLASGFDRQSCMSSPEELTAYSDFSRNRKTSSCQLENEMSCWRGNLSNRKPVTADHHTFSLGKSIEKALDNSLTNADPFSPTEDNNKVVKKLNLVHGKLTLSEKQPTSAIPKVFPGHHPLNFSNPRKFHPTHVTKSRTWHRAGSSPLAVTDPKSQPSPLPQSHETKTARNASENTIASSAVPEVQTGLVNNSDIPRLVEGTGKKIMRLAGFAKTYRSSKFSFVWKLHDKQSSEKDKNSVGPQKVWPHLLPWKRASYWRSFMHALGTKPNHSALSTASQKLLVSRKRGAIYTRSIHGYSLRMSKVLSVSGSSLKWSKSIEKNSKKANEEATRAVAAAEKRKKEEKDSLPIASKSRNHVSRMFELAMVISWSEIRKSEHVSWQVRRVRWSLRTARLRMARKRRYCQFFTRFGKCNKDDGKCPYIHDPSKIAVCTKFLSGSCSNPDCKLTHKCRKKHTYVCPAFESTGVCPQASTCKLHHPKKMEKKPTTEPKIIRGRYFDGGLIGDANCSMDTTEKLSAKGKDDTVCHEGKFPDYISLDVSDEEMDHRLDPRQVCDDIMQDAH